MEIQILEASFNAIFIIRNSYMKMNVQEVEKNSEPWVILSNHIFIEINRNFAVFREIGYYISVGIRTTKHHSLLFIINSDNKNTEISRDCNNSFRYNPEELHCLWGNWDEDGSAPLSRGKLGPRGTATYFLSAVLMY